jgi:hypothetical protein
LETPDARINRWTSGRRFATIGAMAVLTKAPARLVGAALLLALASVVAPASAGDRLSARVELYGPLGIHVLTVRTTLEQTEERYSAAVDYATIGLAGILFEQKTHAVATGRLGRATAYPDTFLNDTVRNGVARRSRVDYRPDGTVEGSSAPPTKAVVPPELMRGTVDNVTAYLRLERQLAETGKCAMTVPIYDGRHRYDLVFADAGKQELSREGGQKFTGSAIACRMTRHNRVVEASEQDEGAGQGMFWYASLIPGEVPVPVRMRLQTQLGTVDGYLAEVQGKGVNLRLLD